MIEVTIRASSDDVLLRAWTETEDGPVEVRPVQPMRGQIAVHGSLLHVDIPDDNGTPRVLSLTIDLDATEGPLLFAQSSLLAEAGFGPAAYDPPQAQVRRRDAEDLASA